MRSVLIPLAAFAVTVTGASAFNSEVLQKAGLTDDQISAFEEAKELRKSGDKDGARDVLEEAGIDMDVMERVRNAMHDQHEALMEAVENNDYPAFLKAIEGSPLADIIDTEAEFKKFVEAHDLLKDGDREAAKAIFDELGIEGHGKFVMKFKGDKEPPFFDKLTDAQKAEVKAAFEAKDHEKVRSILEAAGISMPEKSQGRGFGWGHGNKDKDQDDNDQ